MNQSVTVSAPLFYALFVLATAGLGMAFAASLDLREMFRHRTRLWDLDRELAAVYDQAGAHVDTVRLFQRAARLVRMERLGAPGSITQHELRLIGTAFEEVAARVMNSCELEAPPPHLRADVAIALGEEHGEPLSVADRDAVQRRLFEVAAR